MNALVEKMARADAEFCRRDFDALGQVDKRRFLDRAAFMLRAAREPSDAMLASQGRSRPDLAKNDTQRQIATTLNEQCRSMAKTIWQELIDAAIQEHSTTPPRNAS